MAFNKKRKAQVTLFIILGIIMIAAILFLYFAVSVYQRERLETSVAGAYGAYRISHPVAKYVTTELEHALREGLYLVGMQGGHIYESQGGLTPDPVQEGEDYVLYEEHKVSYGIKKREDNLVFYGRYYSSPPYYPWGKFPYLSGYPGPKDFSAPFVFGKNNLPPLEEEPGQYSIEQQLESFIINYLEENIDLTIFEDQGLEVNGTERNVSVVIGDSDVIARLEYPLGIKRSLTGDVVNISNFYSWEQVRLRTIYAFTNGLIEADISNILFDISDETSYDEWMFKLMMEVEVYKDVFQKEDIIEIIDSNSVLYAEPYKFRFARENRPPALHYIPMVVVSLSLEEVIEGAYITEEFFKPYLKGYDPDEDIIVYPDNFEIEPGLPYRITQEDFERQRIQFKVTVYDGDKNDPHTLKDWQDFEDLTLLIAPR